MSHLHFPDGILPVWLLAIGLIISGIILSISLKKLKREENLAKKVSLLAMMSALIMITMSIPLGFIHYHMNLVVLVGLLLGPWYAFISVFIVSLFLSLIGHGGITVVGLNTLILGTEAFLAYYLYFNLKKYLTSKKSLFTTGVLSILMTTIFMISVVMLASISVETNILGQYLEEGNEIISGILPWFLTVILPMVLIGAIIESLLTIFIAKYLHKVKPTLVTHLEFEAEKTEEEMELKG